ncbi:hypothetical protein N665_0181s0002 [Sinapis alba]|nr:hypothetical protein N665_0181s0002 [Sinapis alba]
MDLKCFLISALIFSLLSNSPILILADQVNTPCSQTTLSSVTGCMSFLTGGAISPTWDCCGALKTLTGTASSSFLYAPGPASLGPTTSPLTETQYPEGPASFGPATSPTSSMDPDSMPDYTDMSEPDNGRDPREPPKTSASSPYSSDSLKLSFLLFALFAFEFISFF